MPTQYELMRLSETEDDDAWEDTDFADEPSDADWEEEYLAFYDDCKLKNSTKLDW